MGCVKAAEIMEGSCWPTENVVPADVMIDQSIALTGMFVCQYGMKTGHGNSQGKSH